MKVFTILNSEGTILKLEMKRNFHDHTTLTFCANINTGNGTVYFPVSKIELLEFFNSKIKLWQIILHADADQFLMLRNYKWSFVEKPIIINDLQCGDMLFREILDDMKISVKDIARLLKCIDQ